MLVTIIPGKFKRTIEVAMVGLFFAVLSLLPLTQPRAVEAAAGTNQQINFQGKVVNPDGTNIPNGTYNIQFKIYQDGDGVLGGGDETLKWTESRLRDNTQGVTITDGIFQVNLGSVNTALGSAVDFNQDTLWLSINLGNTNATCTPFSSCAPDGEMDPFIRFTSAPYAMNSGKLNGLTSSQFVQLAQGVQTDSSTASSIFLNKTGASGNIVQLQNGASDVFVIGNAGTTAINTNSATALTVQNGSNNAFGVDTSNIKVAIGLATSSATSRLSVAGQGSANGITLGDGASGSANLYVSANDTLKTDDDLIVGGDDLYLGSTSGIRLSRVSDTEFRFYTSGGEQLRVTDNNIFVFDNNIIANAAGSAFGKVSVATDSISSVGLAVRAAAGQLSDLLQLQDSTGAVLSSFGPNGILGVGTAASSGYGIITGGNSTYSTIGNLGYATAVDFGYNPGTGLAAGDLSLIAGTVGSSRSVGVALNYTGASFKVVQNAASATTPVAIIKGGATPGAGGDLLQVQNSSGVNLARFDANGVLIGANGAGANNAGSSLTIAGGQGTGSAAGGNILFQYSPAGGAGSSLNALQTACTISGTNGSLSCPGAGADSERFGLDSTAVGVSALAVGKLTSAVSNYSTAIGNGAVAGTSGGSLSATAVGAGATATGHVAVAVGSGAIANANQTIAIGQAASAGFAGSIAIGNEATTTATGQLVIGSSIGSAAISSVYIGNGVTSAAPVGTTINATGSSTTAVAGGALTLQGGAATVGNANGGGVIVQGGAGVGTGVLGLVSLAPTVFSAATSQSFAANGTITQANIDSFSTVVLSSSVVGPVTVTVPNPTNSTVGRILYVTVTGSNSIIITTPGGSPNFTLAPNTSATFIWNGADWTNAGVDGGSNSYIQNQSSADQTANFRISGTGQANTSYISPLFKSLDSSGGGNSANVTFQSGDQVSGSGTSGSVTITSGNGTSGNRSSGNVSIDVGTKAGTGTAGTISIGTTNATALTIGNTTGATATTLQAGTGNLNFNASQAQFSEVTGTRTLTVQTRTTNIAGSSLTVSGGTAGSGGSAFIGGTLTLQGGNAGGTGNASGANVVLRGGTGVGTGVSGIVEIDTPVFTASATQAFGSNGTITQAIVDTNSTIPVNATAASLTITLPAPTNTTVGRIIYVTSITGSNSFTIAPAGGTNFVMNANMSGTFIWNGSGWTNAGVDGGSSSYIQNQNSVDQVANFRINGTGRANTSFISPLVDGISAALGGAASLGVGTSSTGTTALSIGNTSASFSAESNATADLFNGATAHTIRIGSGAAVQGITLGSTNTTSATNIQGGTTGAINVGSVGASTLSSTTNIATTSDGTGTQTINIGSAANVANVLNLSAGSTGKINLLASTVVAATKSLTVTSGATSLTGDTTGDALTVSNNTSTGNIAVFKDNATAVATIADGGLITLQPSANLTAGQTHIAQTLTNASSTGGTVVGYDQNITINNTVSASTTYGKKLTLTNNAGAGFTNTVIGSSINISGSASSGSYIGQDITVSKGIGLRAVTSASQQLAVTCGNVSTSSAIALCADDASGANTGVGIYARSTSRSNSAINDYNGAAVYGVNTSSGGSAANFYAGVKGLALQSSATASTSTGVYGEARGGAGATTYGGYFTLTSASTATLGSALYASNSSIATNILQLQDNTTDVLTVSDGGSLSVTPAVAAATITLGSTAQTGLITLGQSTAGQAINIGTAGHANNAVTIEAGTGSNAIQIGNGSTNHEIRIGANASGVQAVSLGSTSSTSNTTISGGTGTATGDIVLQTAASGIINIGTNNVATKVINIGSVAAVAQNTTLHIADSSAGVQTLTVGSLSSTSTTGIQGGTGASAIALTTGTTGGAAGGISIGNTAGANTQTISIGTNATASSSTAVNIGSTIAGVTTLQSAGGVKVNTLIAGSATSQNVCRDTSTLLLTSCDANNATGAAFLNGLNTFTATATLGTNSSSGANGNLQIQTNGVARAIFDTSNSLYFGNADATGVNTAPSNFSLRGTTSSAAAAGAAGGQLTVKAGNGTSTGSGSAGGVLALSGGAAGGDGTVNRNGGNLTLDGGAKVGSGGTIGHVILQGSGGNVGIGTSVPAAKLELRGTSGSADDLISLYGNNGVDGDEQRIRLGTSGTAIFNFEDATNVEDGSITLGLVGNDDPVIHFKGIGGDGASYIGQNDDASGGLAFCASDTTSTCTTRQFILEGVNGNALFKNSTNSTTAFLIQSSTATDTLFTVDTTTTANTGNKVKIGNDSVGNTTQFVLDTATTAPSTDGAGINGSMYYDSTLGRIQCYESGVWGRCSALNQNVTLVPEYPGAVLTGDGATNVGTMTSDFCSDFQNVADGGGTAACDTNQEHNYYTWTTTQGSTQDYDIFVRYQLPSDFGGFVSSSSIQMYGWRTDNGAGNLIDVSMYEGSTQCGTTTNVATAAATDWSLVSLGGDETGCSGLAAGDTVLFRLHLSAENTEFVRAGEIVFDYKSK